MDIDTKRREKQKLLDRIGQQEAARSDKMRRFGERFPTLMQRLKNSQKTFRIKPLGPIGQLYISVRFTLKGLMVIKSRSRYCSESCYSTYKTIVKKMWFVNLTIYFVSGAYVTLKDPRWVRAVERCLGQNLLKSFCVDNMNDFRELRKIIDYVFNQSGQRKPDIICSKFLVCRFVNLHIGKLKSDCSKYYAIKNSLIPKLIFVYISENHSLKVSGVFFPESTTQRGSKCKYNFTLSANFFK